MHKGHMEKLNQPSKDCPMYIYCGRAGLRCTITYLSVIPFFCSGAHTGLGTAAH